MKIKSSPILFLLILLLLTVIFSVTGSYEFINVLFLIICPFLLILNRKLLIFIYIITLPTNGFVSTDHNLFGIIHVSYVIHFFTLLALIWDWNTLPKNERAKLRVIDHFKKHALWLTTFLFLYLLLTDIRLAWFGLRDISTSLLISRFFRYTIMFVPILLLIPFSVKDSYHAIIKRGFLISLGLLAGSMIFSQKLHEIGIVVQEADSYLNISASTEFIRRAGIFRSLGDVNSAAGFLAVGFGYTLFFGRTGNRLLSKYLLSGVITLAVLLSGSRTGLISIFLVLLFYLYSIRHNFKELALIAIFVPVICLIAILGGYAEPILARFDSLKIGEGHLDPTYRFGRLGGWIFYLELITSDLSTFLLGTSKNIYAAIGSYIIDKERVAHNYYIQLWYYWGLLVLLLFLKRIFKLVGDCLRRDNRFLPVVLPFILTLLFVSDTGVFLALIVALVSLRNGVSCGSS